MLNKRVKTGLHEADWLTRREIIRALVKRVEIDQEQVRVVFRVNPPPHTPQPPSEKDVQSLQHCRGRAYPALWDSKIAVLKEPVFHQSRFQETGDEFQETPISNAFCQAIEENFVMHVVKAFRDVPFNEPRCTIPLLDFSEGRVTSASWSEPVRVL